MKKVLFVLAFSLLIVGKISAQNQMGRISFSGNLSYGTEVESLGIGLRTQYGFTDYIRASAEYKYYIDRHNLSAWGINIDGHYVFGISGAVSLYPLVGINCTRWTYDPGRSDVEGAKYSNNRIGMNLGLGSQVELSYNTFLQIEAKEAFIKNYSQFAITVGFMYQF
ncbi:outer membrane beta-barrel protein [Prevotella sp. 10(H)]|uniref:outer membrane beta-barrel protein n=1 Tax=Prevotella sp. 10(H) TaxID=1158294 RepID=UPI00068ED060|nr:outer membrane beta-barrel protein [Prevotella sp. 10(H)]